MTTIEAGKTKLIVWADPDVQIAGSAVDVGQTTVFSFADNGVQSFRAGRNPALNSLSEFEQWVGYQVTAVGGTVTVPETTLGFRNPPTGGGQPELTGIWLTPNGGLWVTPTDGVWIAA